MQAFIELRQVFVKDWILNYFDIERNIQIETNTLGYAISDIFSQLTSDDLSQ